MAVGGVEEYFRRRRSGQGISPVAVDEVVVGAAMIRWMTVPMKREDEIKESWSGTVDERLPSLPMDDGIGEAPPQGGG